MLQRTYDKVNALFEEGNGYLPTRKMLDNKITTIQIRTMLEEGKIEKISHVFFGKFQKIYYLCNVKQNKRIYYRKIMKLN